VKNIMIPQLEIHDRSAFFKCQFKQQKRNFRVRMGVCITLAVCKEIVPKLILKIRLRSSRRGPNPEQTFLSKIFNCKYPEVQWKTGKNH
jgi:hypothetical protein